MKKNLISITIIIVMLIVITLSANAQTYKITINSGVSGSTPIGSVWMEKSSSTNTSFITLVYVNTGEQKLAAYGIDITYDKSIVDIVGVESGKDGFIATSNKDNNTGTYTIAGFDLSGKGPNTKLELLKVSWSVKGTGKSNIGISIETLVDSLTNNIGTPKSYTSNVTISSVASTPVATKTPSIKQSPKSSSLSQITTEPSPSSQISEEPSPTLPNSPDTTISDESSQNSSSSTSKESKKENSIVIYIVLVIFIIAIVVIIYFLRKRI